MAEVALIKINKILNVLLSKVLSLKRNLCNFRLKVNNHCSYFTGGIKKVVLEALSLVACRKRMLPTI